MARFSDDNRCSLCGKPKEGGRKIIVGLHGAVCSDCVELCRDIIQSGGHKSERTDPLAEILERLGARFGWPYRPGTKPLDQLVAMTRELETAGQVILSEGNTSCKHGETLWIKASGAQMAGILEGGFVQVTLDKVIRIMQSPRPTDPELRAALNDARTGQTVDAYPSTETFMHAWLLTLPEVNFVAHTHPPTTLGVMCGPLAREFAENRYFPDQIVLCGPKSVFVPYCAPGFDLAIAIRDACAAFTHETTQQPKTILLENHGLISLGKTAKEALAACLMTEKAAKVLTIAHDPHPLTPEEVEHIHNWSDEHYRQSKLWDE